MFVRILPQHQILYLPLTQLQRQILHPYLTQRQILHQYLTLLQHLTQLQ
jgi:hypothetical protein